MAELRSKVKSKSTFENKETQTKIGAAFFEDRRKAAANKAAVLPNSGSEGSGPSGRNELSDRAISDIQKNINAS